MIDWIGWDWFGLDLICFDFRFACLLAWLVVGWVFFCCVSSTRVHFAAACDPRLQKIPRKDAEGEAAVFLLAFIWLGPGWDLLFLMGKPKGHRWHFGGCSILRRITGVSSRLLDACSRHETSYFCCPDKIARGGCPVWLV